MKSSPFALVALPLQQLFFCALILASSTNRHNEAFAFSILPSTTTSRSSRTITTTQLPSFLGTDVPLTVARLVQPSMVLVTPKGVRNMTARGSGFILAATDNGVFDLIGDDDDTNDENETKNYIYIMTAAHVAAPGHGIDILLHGDDELQRPATVVARNMTLDLALLRIVDDSNNSNIIQEGGLTLATAIPEVGTVAFAHGYPASRLRRPAMTMGIVCGIADGLGVPDDDMSSSPHRRRRKPDNDENENNHQKDDETTFVVTDAAMSGGMSGGPLVDAQGNVLGVNALIRPDLRALGNYAISAEEVTQFLESVVLQQQQQTETKSESSVDKKNGKHDSCYRVYLFNDRMNKKERVSSVLKSVALLDDDTANEVMMQAHATGRGIVGNYTGKVEAETMCTALRDQDLLVEFE